MPQRVASRHIGGELSPQDAYRSRGQQPPTNSAMEASDGRDQRSPPVVERQERERRQVWVAARFVGRCRAAAVAGAGMDLGSRSVFAPLPGHRRHREGGRSGGGSHACDVDDGPAALALIMMATAPNSSIALAQKIPMTPSGPRRTPTASGRVTWARRLATNAAGGRPPPSRSPADNASMPPKHSAHRLLPAERLSDRHIRHLIRGSSSPAGPFATCWTPWTTCPTAPHTATPTKASELRKASG